MFCKGGEKISGRYLAVNASGRGQEEVPAR